MRRRKPHKKSIRRFRRKNWVKQNFCCLYCGLPMKLAESTIDHIIPKSMGGTWHHRNLALVCWQCNQAKADTLIDDPEWEQALKRRKAQ